jgi:hypothetical protein
LLLDNDLSEISKDNLENLFNYFENEFPKLCDENNERVYFKIISFILFNIFIFRNEYD